MGDIGTFIGDCYRVIQGATRSLDCNSYVGAFRPENNTLRGLWAPYFEP